MELWYYGARNLELVIRNLELGIWWKMCLWAKIRLLKIRPSRVCRQFGGLLFGVWWINLVRHRKSRSTSEERTV